MQQTVGLLVVKRLCFVNTAIYSRQGSGRNRGLVLIWEGKWKMLYIFYNFTF